MGPVWQAQLGESLIWATLGQRQICQSPCLALNVHSSNDWGPIPVLTGEWPSGRFRVARPSSKKLCNLCKNYINQFNLAQIRQTNLAHKQKNEQAWHKFDTKYSSNNALNLLKISKRAA